MNTPLHFSVARALSLPTPYVLFVGDMADPRFAKTAFGLRDWAPELCLGEVALSADAVATGLPRMTVSQAAALGARAIVIGVANTGGVIQRAWIDTLVEALHAGLDIISGMHMLLDDIPELRAAAAANHRRLIDVRRPPENIPVATGRKRSGKRLLTVGTDCALGKKYTALALARAFRDRGIDAEFRATGQTGIMIAGGGMPMDAVVADFEAGAAEMLSPDADPAHWDVVEGQGSLLHPSYAAVSLGLLHGTQPDMFVVCHEPGRIEMMGMPGFAVPDIAEIIECTLLLGRRVNPDIRCAGISLNTADLSEEDAAITVAETGRRFGLPAADPIRGGPAFEALVTACLGGAVL